MQCWFLHRFLLEGRKVVAIIACFMMVGMISARLVESFFNSDPSSVSTESGKIAEKAETSIFEPNYSFGATLEEIIEKLVLLNSNIFSGCDISVQSFGKFLLPGLSSNDLSPPTI